MRLVLSPRKAVWLYFNCGPQRNSNNSNNGKQTVNMSKLIRSIVSWGKKEQILQILFFFQKLKCK